jgi:hypothetical protein
MSGVCGIIEAQLNRRFMRKIKTHEEKVAEKLADLVSDLRTDLEQVGEYIGRNAESVSYRRLQIVAESAKEEKENGNNI